MCCESLILKVLNALTIIISIALGVTTAILTALGLISVEAVPLLATIILLSTAVVAVLGLIALFFPCSLKCGFTAEAICRYFNKIALSIAGIFIIGLIILILELYANAIATPILLGILVLLAAYLAGNLMQFAYVTVDSICDKPCSQEENSCGCNYLR